MRVSAGEYRSAVDHHCYVPISIHRLIASQTRNRFIHRSVLRRVGIRMAGAAGSCESRTPHLLHVGTMDAVLPLCRLHGVGFTCSVATARILRVKINILDEDHREQYIYTCAYGVMFLTTDVVLDYHQSESYYHVNHATR